MTKAIRLATTASIAFPSPRLFAFGPPVTPTPIGGDRPARVRFQSFIYDHNSCYSSRTGLPPGCPNQARSSGSGAGWIVCWRKEKCSHIRLDYAVITSGCTRSTPGSVLSGGTKLYCPAFETPFPTHGTAVERRYAMMTPVTVQGVKRV